MSVKPSNVVPVLSDLLVISPAIVDFSAASAGIYLFVDDLHDYEVISIHMLITTAYIASQATSVLVGVPADTDKFAVSQSMGTGAVGAGARISITRTATSRLIHGTALVASHTQAASQTGEGKFVIRLRPLDKPGVWSGKRPVAADAVS